MTVPSAPPPALSPDQLRPLLALGSLSSEQASELITRAQSVSAGSSPAQIAEVLSKHLPADSFGLVDQLVTLGVWRYADQISTDEIAELAIPLDAPNRLFVLERISALLSTPPFWQVAKAYDIGTAYKMSMRSCRILTDIRLVYDDDPTVVPETAVISHSLELRVYDESGEQQTLFVSLDQTDLRSLEIWTERARHKAETARAVLQKANIAVHTLETE